MSFRPSSGGGGFADSSVIYVNGNALLIHRIPVTASASGATTVVAAVANKNIRVIAFGLTSSGTVNVKFQSHVVPTDLTGLFYEIAATGFMMNANPWGWFETLTGEALDINLSGAVPVGGVLSYVEVIP